MIRKMQEKKIDFAMLGVIFTLAWPTMLEEFMQTAVQYIDTAMVGSLGTDATAAVGATGTVSWLVMGVMSAVGVGFLAFISQSFGAGEFEQAQRASAQAVTVTLVLGVLFTFIALGLSPSIPRLMQVEERIQDQASRYFMILYSTMLFRAAITIFGTVLRSVGDTKTPMQVGIIMNLVNIVLNYILIYPTRRVVFMGKSMVVYGFGWGISGAAAASAIAFAVGGILITVMLFTHPLISPKGMKFLPDRSILKPCLIISIPNLLQRFATSFGYVVFASMINGLGGISTAAHTIANTVESAFYIPGWGMQAAAATLAGTSYGARDERRLKRVAKAIIPLEIGLMVITGGLLFLFAEPLVRIFSKDPEVIFLGTRVLRMVAVSEPFYGVPIVVEGMMQGVGKTVPPFVFNVTGMWAVRILGTFICIHWLSMGLVSAWACMIGHNLLLFVLFGIYFLTGRWNPMKR